MLKFTFHLISPAKPENARRGRGQALALGNEASVCLGRQDRTLPPRPCIVSSRGRAQCAAQYTVGQGDSRVRRVFLRTDHRQCRARVRYPRGEKLRSGQEPALAGSRCRAGRSVSQLSPTRSFRAHCVAAMSARPYRIGVGVSAESARRRDVFHALFTASAIMACIS